MQPPPGFWSALSCDLNEGITPLPFVTRSTTSAFGGFASSRFGPTVPVAPASFSVWQLVQPAVWKTCLPAATCAPPPALPPPPLGFGGGAGEGVGFVVSRAGRGRRAAGRGDAGDRGDVGGDVLRVLAGDEFRAASPARAAPCRPAPVMNPDGF